MAAGKIQTDTQNIGSISEHRLGQEEGRSIIYGLQIAMIGLIMAMKQVLF